MVRAIVLLFRFSNDRLHREESGFPIHCFLDSHLCDVLVKPNQIFRVSAVFVTSGTNKSQTVLLHIEILYPTLGDNDDQWPLIDNFL